ncbi:hypothetical protein [Streptomyces sp. NPDC001422]|uniref:hypothetical protein n=1 Tax=unclassified Streptomyces TaxID=2593676 RepID=UPI00367EB1C9
MRKRVSRTWWIELAVYVAFGVLAATVLCMAGSVLLMGLPHGWQAATTWAQIEHRFLWLVVRLVPASVAVYLIVRVRRGAMEFEARDGSGASTRYHGQHR